MKRAKAARAGKSAIPCPDFFALIRTRFSIDPAAASIHPSDVKKPGALKLCFAFLGLVFAGCYAPSGEYGGNVDADPSGPYGIQGADVVKSEEVGTGFDPWGGICNYEEVNFGPPSS